MNNKNKKIKNFTDLNAWREGHKLVLMVYKITKDFPQEELFGLTSQIKRASISITSNIAEGFSRLSYAEKIQFYSIAQGSNTELQNQLLIARDIRCLDKDNFDKIIQQSISVHKLINGLIKGARSFKKHNS
jgi:four helix bundle protein